MAASIPDLSTVDGATPASDQIAASGTGRQAASGTGSADGSAQEPPIPRSEIVLSWLFGNPLVTPAVGLMAGILIDNAHAVPLILAGLLFVAAGVLVVRASSAAWTRYIGLCLAGLATGAVLHDTSFRRWPADHLVRCCPDEPVMTSLRGTVVSAPLVRSGAGWYPTNPNTRFVLSAEQVESDAGFVKASGLVNVRVAEPALSVRVGQRVELFGRLQRTSAARNPGGPDFSLIARRNGVLVQVTCSRADDIVPLPAGGSGWRAWLGHVRGRARGSMLADTFDGDVPGSGLLAAMVLGQRSAIDPALNDAFVRSGTVHYLSVSGAHVGMLVMVIFGLGSLVGAGRRQCAMLAMLAATSYALLAEPSAPMIRATILTDLGCLALLGRRGFHVANWLAASVLVLLVFQPTQLFDPGFVLSYLTLLSVIYLLPCISAAVGLIINRALGRTDPLLLPAIQQKIGMRKLTPWRDRFVRGYKTTLSASTAAWATGSLISAYYFQQWPMWGWFNTIILMPIMWLTMVIGLAKTVLASVAPAVSSALGWPLAAVTKALVWVVEAMAAMPGAGVCTPQIPAWLVWFGLLVALVWVLQQPLRLSVHAVLIPAVVFAACLVWSIAPRPASESLTVHVLAVGNGTSTLIELPNGRNLVYDVGCSPPYDVEKWTLGPLLSRDHCSRIDAVLLSHANLDHYCGLSTLLDRRAVSAVMTTPHFDHAAQAHSVSRSLMATVKSKPGLWRTIARGDRLSGTGAVEVDVLWPPREELKPADTNDTSMVLRVAYANRRVLLCGDVEEFALRELTATADLRADVLVLPHHGSVTPSTAAFVRAVGPAICLRSSARPAPAALVQLLEGRHLLSTSENGAIEIRITPDGLCVVPTVPLQLCPLASKADSPLNYGSPVLSPPPGKPVRP